MNDEAQLINYLKATELRVGVLINFSSYSTLEWKRFINLASTKGTYKLLS